MRKGMGRIRFGLLACLRRRRAAFLGRDTPKSMSFRASDFRVQTPSRILDRLRFAGHFSRLSNPKNIGRAEGDSTMAAFDCQRTGSFERMSLLSLSLCPPCKACDSCTSGAAFGRGVFPAGLSAVASGLIMPACFAIRTSNHSSQLA